MKRLLLVPCILFPYVLLFNIYCIYTGFLMEEVFNNFILYNLLYLFMYVIIVLICNIIYIVLCRVKGENPKNMARDNMIVKLAQIPGYIVVFVLGFICMLTLFTIGFSFFFFVYDCLSIFLTGMIGFFAVVFNKNKNEKLCWSYIILMISQFVFCLDVVTSIVLYLDIGIIKNIPTQTEKESMPISKISKMGLFTYLGALMFGSALALSEVLFPDSEEFLNVNIWFDLFFYLSLIVTLFGFIIAIIFKNKTNSSLKEFVIEIIISVLSLILMISGIIFSEELLGRALFSFSCGIFMINTFGYIQTLIGILKSKKKALV